MFPKIFAYLGTGLRQQADLLKKSRRCGICAAVFNTSEPYCSACAAELLAWTDPFCAKCGALRQTSEDCLECGRVIAPWKGIFFHSEFSGLLRDLIISFKFAANFGCLNMLGELLYNAYLNGRKKGFLNSSPPDILLPVPLHLSRLRWRGFNHSLEMSRKLALKEKLPLRPNAVIKTRSTTPQAQLDFQNRIVALKDVFIANSEEVSGKRVLVIDDVSTTGATISEVSMAVLKAGALSVDVLLLAKTSIE